MDRRTFLTALSLFTADRLVAGSLSLDDINSIRNQSGLDASRYEKEVADVVWKELQKTGYNYRDRRGTSQFPLIKDPAINRIIDDISAPLCSASTRKGLNWRVGLTTCPIVNAVTWGGGVILLYVGLLDFCNNEEEFAGVIAHEIGHNEYRHAQKGFLSRGLYNEFVLLDSLDSRSARGGYEKFMNDLTYLSYKGYGRLNEFEADAFIVRAFLNTSYDVRRSSACSEMLIRLNGTAKVPDEKTCLYSSHPVNLERLRRVEAIQRTHLNSGKIRNTGMFDDLKTRVANYIKQNGYQQKKLA